MTNVIVYVIDHNALVRALSKEMDLGTMKLHIGFDAGNDEPTASICAENHLHLIIGFGMPLNVVWLYALAAYLFCYASHGKAFMELPSLQEGMLAFEVFLRRSAKRSGPLYEYIRMHREHSEGLVFAYRDLLALLEGGQRPQPVFMQIAEPTGKKEDLN